MLNSMIESGERHTTRTREMVNNAQNELEQLRQHNVMCEFHCERFDFGRDKKCEQQCSGCHWMQTKLQ